VDAATAARLSPHDGQRIQRALEVHALTGRALSSLHGTRDVAQEIGPSLVVALVPSDRAMLHAAIARRFDAMLMNGLIDEVRTLRARYAVTADMPSMRCVGYRQTFQFLDGSSDQAALRERGIAATRQLAKRQLTWLRSLDVQTLECFGADVIDRASAIVARGLAGFAGRKSAATPQAR